MDSEFGQSDRNRFRVYYNYLTTIAKPFDRYESEPEKLLASVAYSSGLRRAQSTQPEEAIGRAEKLVSGHFLIPNMLSARVRKGSVIPRRSR